MANHDTRTSPGPRRVTTAARSDAIPAWRARPVLASAIRLIATLGPLAFAFLFSWTFAGLVPPGEFALGEPAWWVIAIVTIAGASRLVARWFERAIPLSALLRLALVFPDRAPSRFKTALRAPAARDLERRLHSARTSKTGRLSDPAHGSPADIDRAEYLVGLLSALTTHDRHTRGHSERVRAYATMIGEQLDLDGRDRHLLVWRALLHDVGKLEVSPELLNKPAKPTAAEWERLKQHPAAAERLLAPLASWLGEWGLAASEHHLRWDGTGYPTSTGGTDISRAGRIVAVADAYDVMTSRRAYKDPMSHEAARAEVARCSGSQFDPEIVRAFLGIGAGRLGAVYGPGAAMIGTILGRTPQAVTAALQALIVGGAILVGATAASPTDVDRAEAAKPLTAVAASVAPEGLAYSPVPATGQGAGGDASGASDSGGSADGDASRAADTSEEPAPAPPAPTSESTPTPTPEPTPQAALAPALAATPTPAPTPTTSPTPTTDPTTGPTAAPSPDPESTDESALLLLLRPQPSPTPIPTPSPTPIPTPSPTPIPTPSPTPTPTPTPSPTPIPTPSPTPTPTPSPTPIPTPSPTPTIGWLGLDLTTVPSSYVDAHGVTVSVASPTQALDHASDGDIHGRLGQSIRVEFDRPVDIVARQYTFAGWGNRDQVEIKTDGTEPQNPVTFETKGSGNLGPSIGTGGELIIGVDLAGIASVTLTGVTAIEVRITDASGTAGINLTYSPSAAPPVP